ncbi:hypothetical protein G9C98_000289 [Cotesia typhae]|uniref:Uncharacterized protein n=1 Tax=Cotesia typhae TaxID=2053667 RepID=A0A8J5V9T5_9HYME|nr:hypothetical protein G9C98_000289 [Cotesia typhae]
MDPPAAFPQAAVNAVPPDTRGKIDLPLPASGVQNRRDNKLFTNRELINNNMTSRVHGIKHPEGPDDGQSRTECLIGVLLQQRGDSLLSERGQGLGHLQDTLVIILAR